MAEEDKFSYAPLQKAFEKQTETIDDQGEKQTIATEKHIKQQDETNVIEKKNYFDSHDCEKRNIYELYNKIFFKILNDKIDYNNLKHKYKSGKVTNCDNITNAIGFVNKTKNSEIIMEESKKHQNNIKET